MQAVSFKRHRFPPDVIRQAVWLYFRFTLSLRDVEEMLAERGIETNYETIRCWALEFGRVFAQRLGIEFGVFLADTGFGKRTNIRPLTRPASEFQPTFIHTKLLIVNGVWSVIGSTNMDNRSRKINDEIVFGISDAGFARTLEDTLAGDLRRATEIKRASWE